MTSIADLCVQHDTDKGTHHRYGEMYDLLFGRHRSTAKRVLEIGVLDGASIRVWADAFPQAEVYGVDVAIPAGDWPDNVRMIEADAYDPAFVDSLPGPFDVIVDDGTHALVHAVFVARHYAPRLAKGGTLVIEDMQDRSYGPRIADGLAPEFRHNAFVIDRTVIAPGARMGIDSRLFVVDMAGQDAAT